MKHIKLFENFEEDIFNKVREEYFSSEVIDFNKNQLDGYKIINNKVSFGCRIGNNADIGYLFHEMGHFVYFKDYNRLLKNSYGLDYPKEEVYGKEYDMVLNWNDIKNETKVVCWQYTLANHFNVANDIKKDIHDDWITSLRLLSGMTFVPVKDATQLDNYHWVDKDGNELSYSECEKGKIEYLKSYFDAEILNPIYNIAEFNTRWFDRVKFLENKFK